MTKYILKRIGMAAVTAWLVATFTFFLMNMVPGGPFMAEKALTPQAQQAMMEKYGLDKPLTEQYTIYPTAYITRLMRSSMLDVLGQDYMRTARAKGVSWVVSVFKHALRNAILPVVTYLGPLLAYTVTGSFIVEKIFTIPGLGSEFIGAITGRDYPLIMGTTRMRRHLS